MALSRQRVYVSSPLPYLGLARNLAIFIMTCSIFLFLCVCGFLNKFLLFHFLIFGGGGEVKGEVAFIM